jgi:hypothetical protein
MTILTIVQIDHEGIQLCNLKLYHYKDQWLQITIGFLETTQPWKQTLSFHERL